MCMLIDSGEKYSEVDFVISGHAECNIQNIPDSTLRTALLVGGDISEPITVNQQLIEQVDSFFKTLDRCHIELNGGELSPPSDIICHLRQDRPKNAFRSLVRWQKDCLKLSRKIDAKDLDKICSWFVFPSL